MKAISMMDRRSNAVPTGFRLSRQSITVSKTPIGPLRCANGDVLWIRPPKYSDGPSWRDTCRRESDRLAHVLGDVDEGWEASTSLVAWAERLRNQRTASRQGLAISTVVAFGDGQIAGEVSFAVDPRTSVVEASIWLSETLPNDARAWVVAMCLIRVCSLPDPIAGIVAPVAISNPGPGPLFTAIGFERTGRCRQLRRYDGAWTDHDIWWLDSRQSILGRVGQLLAALPGASTSQDLVRADRGTGITLPMMIAASRARYRSIKRWRPAFQVSQRIHLVNGSVQVNLPLDHLEQARVDHRHIGLVHLRFDGGSSTLEAWSHLDHRHDAEVFLKSLVMEARQIGARRVAWSVRPGSPEHCAAIEAGLISEGRVASPVWDTRDLLEVYAVIVSADV